ncbi:unnamed protein product [Rotaria sordida]|uniref:K Homology domain-containing protein n=1 Tax=Rotaria sordida TaxID=392033 RepID=A0A814XW31_9BILA|nr:unnamed protein product [Rotaria sordida]CAF3866631.1 unnamed protein product [Rotaria sordida]
MTTSSTDCIVHNRKYLSKFHGIINKLHRTNEFSFSVLRRLPKRCCTCHSQTGEYSLTLDDLRKLCQDIKSTEEQLPSTSTSLKCSDYVILEFSSMLSPIQRMYQVGRFVGRGGVHLRLLERTLNVRINIINNKSSKNLQQMIDKIKTKNKESHKDGLWILINMKKDNHNHENNLDKIKQLLQDEWKKIDVLITKKKRTVINPSSQTRILSKTNIFRDNRWKPKNHRRNKKYQQKQKESIVPEEVLPQPFVPPISMPKEVVRSHKTKRT